MGNKLCKKRVDNVDTVDNPKSPTPFDRIINKFNLKPRWKSDSNLDDKEVNSYQVNAVPNEKHDKNETPVRPPRPFSRSTDWTDVPLEVPEKDNSMHQKSANLSGIFNDNSTPVPPPRKHKKSIREKIESVTKSSLQAFQSKKPEKLIEVPVDEPLCIKKVIDYSCPYCDARILDGQKHDHGHHNNSNVQKPNVNKESSTPRESKRRKSSSVVSLPNYADLKLSVAGENNENTSELEKHSSLQSLPDDNKKLSAKSSTDKIDNYITRARSFGSLLPTILLHKLSTAKAPLAEIESDDSLGGFDDWGLNMIEHYKPKDSSLPRPRKQPNKTETEMLSDIESMIVNEADFAPPTPPSRTSESLVKKINRESSESAYNKRSNDNPYTIIERSLSVTPPPTPEEEIRKAKIPASELPVQDENGQVEHSNLMKILEQYSINDKSNAYNIQTETFPIHLTENPTNNNVKSKNINEFLDAERAHLTTPPAIDLSKLGYIHNSITT